MSTGRAWLDQAALKLSQVIRDELAGWPALSNSVLNLDEASRLLADRIVAELVREQEEMEAAYRRIVADGMATLLAGAIRDAHRSHPQGFTPEGWKHLLEIRGRRDGKTTQQAGEVCGATQEPVQDA